MDEDDVKIFRLSSGEDIIAKVLGYDDENYVLYNPMNVMIKTKNNNSTLVMYHWLPIEIVESFDVNISMKDVITIINPKLPLIEYFLNATDQLNQLRELEEIHDVDDDMFSNMNDDKNKEGLTIH